MEWPEVVVVVVTYNRAAEVRRVIEALQDHIQYKGAVGWHLADDGSLGSYVQNIIVDYPNLRWTFTITNRRGWGRNVNTALRFLAHRSNYIFLCEDDYVAQRDLDLTNGVALLEAEPSIGAIRYDGLAGHSLNLMLREAATAVGVVQYLSITKDSSCLNVYSNRPHLKHRRFHGSYGLYPEGLPLGCTEETFAHTVKDKVVNGPSIVVLENGITRTFDHVGRSWKGTPADV